MDHFYRLVVIEDRRRVGSRRNVGSVQEAAEILVSSHWPQPRGARHREAATACLQAEDGIDVFTPFHPNDPYVVILPPNPVLPPNPILLPNPVIVRLGL